MDMSQAWDRFWDKVRPAFSRFLRWCRSSPEGSLQFTPEGRRRRKAAADRAKLDRDFFAEVAPRMKQELESSGRSYLLEEYKGDGGDSKEHGDR